MTEETNEPINIDQDKLEKQIRDQYYRAYFDVLKEKIEQDPPDYEWIVRLYEEIKLKLVKLFKEGSTTRKEIEEILDIELFDQMLRNNAYNVKDFEKLTNYIFELCIKFGSPQRDKSTADMRDEILNEVKRGSGFSTLIPMFIENANTCVDHIYEDLQTTLRNIDKKNSSNI
jgi:hypothetical protein